MKPTRIVEALLFASDAPLRAEEISRADESLDEDRVEEAIRELREEYAAEDRAFDIAEISEGYQILTRPEFAPYLERFDTVPRPARLSAAALETLGIICYRQPIGRVEIEFIRGVSSSGVIRTLTDRDLIEVAGRGEGLGRPLLYGTTQRFLEHFGFNSLEDLPRPEELPVILRERVPLLEDPLGDPLLPEDEVGGEAAGEGRDTVDHAALGAHGFDERGATEPAEESTERVDPGAEDAAVEVAEETSATEAAEDPASGGRP